MTMRKARHPSSYQKIIKEKADRYSDPLPVTVGLIPVCVPAGQATYTEQAYVRGSNQIICWFTSTSHV
jgi:hypothetical protein